MTESLNWSGELEAVHEDGRVVPAIFSSFGNGGVANVQFGGKYEAALMPAGYVGNGWRIRNRKPASDNLEARKDALIRRIAIGDWSPCHETEAEARALVAEMEPPVDADLIEAREMAAGAQLPSVGELTRKGTFDNEPIVRAALAAIKRGRELQQQEQGK